MTLRVNVNADLGEGYGAYRIGDDAAMLDIVRSANIACGFHAGDPLVMARTVHLALARGVSLGAHPGFPDLQGFGRRPMTMSLAEIEAMVAYQIGALQAIATAAGGRVSHVKPHGALSTMAAVDHALALAIATAIKAVDPGLIFLAPAGSQMVHAGWARGLAVVEEVFADRNYDDAGALLPRSHPRALIHVPEEAAEHGLRMLSEGVILSANGRELPCAARSICVHGDAPGAVALAGYLRCFLEDHDLEIVPLPEVLGEQNAP
ncbi:hypothetical protein CKO38_00515 [Rhodospirillum rubrum]|uniref:LamB/YcsF family protein n=1 Tax=Rhodospirillum rubrum TaxID=1085 RepID=UPI001908B222|nr:5-oxoprolinase subunit PxpA [Rhodospirillum rubrum]MBK1663159.1 hypothetical protein [Rhodospirillum rubrum]MBK1675176.1 hypothetical protein [Rhodospirillum rubrum]